PRNWIAEHVLAGECVGFDAWLLTKSQADALRETLQKQQAILRDIPNPVDLIWHDQPLRPIGAVELHNEEYRGFSTSEKLDIVREKMQKDDIDCTIVTASDAIAWLLNVRGSDVSFNPITHSWLVVGEDKTHWFVDPLKIDEEVWVAKAQEIVIAEEESFCEKLPDLVKNKVVGVRYHNMPDAIITRIAPQARTIKDWDNGVELAKACKSVPEIEGARLAHDLDAIAMIEFLAKLSEIHAQGAKITEMQASAMINNQRLAHAACVDLSFDTISATGPNAAICHYRVSAQCDRTMQPGDLYLVDSGGQYRFGTTDITRTIAVSDVACTDWRKECFTRVLQGHITLARARFPKGTRGSNLDVLAREALWQAGLDFDHGTGHGVGSFLNVHEGPQRISRGSGDVALQVGMIISNEPGYYAPDDFGIRIENLVCVCESSDKFLYLETVSHVPIDRRLINVAMLSPEHRTWLNAYHVKIWEKYNTRISPSAQRWLQESCHEI
ncbi:MAG: aminopeptidase family protein P, partial [Pseudomonadota bacterium]